MLREYIRAILTESFGALYYHGRDGSTNFNEGKPAFFTKERGAAEWYAESRGDRSPTVHTAQLTFSNPASSADLTKAVKLSGATGKDVATHSPNGPDDFFNDYLYVPSVQQTLEEMGFDAFEGWDILTNEEVEIVVVWHPRQIHIVKSERVG